MKNLEYLIATRTDTGMKCMFHGFMVQNARIVIVYDTYGNVIEVDVT